jgi:D-alanyl-D-alanine carboxypeptidase
MKILAKTVCLIALFAFALPAAAQEPAPPPPTAMAAGTLIDDQGKILWASNDETPRAPASLTKVLTALVVLERGSLDDTAVITPDARSVGGSSIYAEEGWTFSVRDLLWAMLMQSGNDAAIALAHRLSPNQTVEGFVNLMNEKARALGARNSNFRNPHGLDEPDHYSTARDLAIIAMEALKNPVFAEMAASQTHEITWADGTPHLLTNHNKLLWTYQGTVGIKTGFTRDAGHSLASAVHRDGRTLIAVVLGSPDHYGESIALYEWAFPNLSWLGANGSKLRPPKLGDAQAANSAPSIPDGQAADSAPSIPELIRDDARVASRNSGNLPWVEALVAIGIAAAVALLLRTGGQQTSGTGLLD